VTTRTIAQAAGVAEGTIFRVFDTKDDLLAATVASAMDPMPLVARLRGLPVDLPLRDRLVAAARLLQERLTAIARLLDAVGMTHPPNDAPVGADRDRRPATVPHEAVMRALADLVAPDAAALRLSPDETARRLRLLTFAASHPRITDNNPLTPDEIVDLLLDGVRRRSDPDDDGSHTAAPHEEPGVHPC
jgi:AcrR family transcriptional regulator